MIRHHAHCWHEDESKKEGPFVHKLHGEYAGPILAQVVYIFHSKFYRCCHCPKTERRSVWDDAKPPGY